MNKEIMDSIKNRLSLKVAVYVTKDTHKSLEKDLEDFNIKNMNKFINLLVENYISDYFESVYDGLPEIRRILEENIPNINATDELVKSIAFSKSNFADHKETKKDTINLRLQKRVVNIAVEALYNAPSQLDLSAFFRGMILSYLALPIYRREQIIYKKEISRINNIIRNKEQLSYSNKLRKKTHVINPYVIDYSSYEMFNYLIGQLDEQKPNITTIRIANMEDIIPIHEKSSFSENFEESYDLMKDNGIQFGMDKTKIRKIYLNDEQYKTYERRYFEKPRPVNHKMKNGLHELSFNCSYFQLKSFFTPFDEGDENIIKIKK